MALTGIWHGAGWNYFLWGGANGLLVVIERIIQNKSFYKNVPNVIKYGFTMLVVLLLWQCFRWSSIADIFTLFGIILGTVRFERIYYSWQHYFDAQILVFVMIGIFGATVMGLPSVQRWKEKLISGKAGYLLQEIVLLLLFVLAILFMINSTYSPFIYFQY